MKLDPVPWLQGIAPYVPGNPSAAEAGRLASNESAVGASELAWEAVAEVAQRLFRYPDPLADRLRAKLGQELDVDPDQLLIGNGSDELIYLLALAYLAGGRTCLLASPAYRVHEIAAQIVAARVEQVPLAAWRHDLATMAEHRADVAFICNPHNPTGTTVSAAEVEAFLGRCQANMVVVDEAYIDFVDEPANTSALRLARSGEVVVLRTFSKLFGLAGARLGYLIGPPELIAVLRKIRPPFSVSSLAQAAAEAVLDDRSYRERARRLTLEMRGKVAALFEGAGFQCVPSQANFILVLARDEQGLVARLQAQGVSVRPGTALGFPGSVRVTVPGPEGCALLEQALR